MLRAQDFFSLTLSRVPKGEVTHLESHSQREESQAWGPIIWGHWPIFLHPMLPPGPWLVKTLWVPV